MFETVQLIAYIWGLVFFVVIHLIAFSAMHPIWLERAAILLSAFHLIGLIGASLLGLFIVACFLVLALLVPLQHFILLECPKGSDCYNNIALSFSTTLFFQIIKFTIISLAPLPSYYAERIKVDGKRDPPSAQKVLLTSILILLSVETVSLSALFLEAKEQEISSFIWAFTTAIWLALVAALVLFSPNIEKLNEIEKNREFLKKATGQDKIGGNK